MSEAAGKKKRSKKAVLHHLDLMPLPYVTSLADEFLWIIIVGQHVCLNIYTWRIFWLNYNILDIDCVQLKIIEHAIFSDALEVP